MPYYTFTFGEKTGIDKAKWVSGEYHENKVLEFQQKCGEENAEHGERIGWSWKIDPDSDREIVLIRDDVQSLFRVVEHFADNSGRKEALNSH